MASSPPANAVNNTEDDFEKHFNEFAAKAPIGEEPLPDLPPEEEASEPLEASAPAPAEEALADPSGPSTGAEAPAEEAPDPWATLPPEIKSQFEALQRERDQALHRAQSDANRVAALSRKIAAQNQGVAAKVQGGGEPDAAKQALDDKLKQLREDYSEIAEPLIEVIQAQRNELDTVKQVIGQVASEREEAVIEAERRALEERHPDYREIASDPGFAEWLSFQPDNIQALAGSWDARETSVALTLFKAERMAAAPPEAMVAAPEPTAPTADARRAQQLDGGRQVRSRPAPAASGAPNDFDAAFAHYAAKRERDRLAGRPAR